ncbi:MAG: hypothetical protein GF330_02105 [Candidatus Eisenbacteria bacterium]|nr:hypothetical protein [Candidatus Eisenbacteria bacterium]
MNRFVFCCRWLSAAGALRTALGCVLLLWWMAPASFARHQAGGLDGGQPSHEAQALDAARTADQASASHEAQALAWAAALEGAAAARSGPVAEALLRRAQWAYFAAAVPQDTDPPDDPRRQRPGRGWEDYLRLAREALARAVGDSACRIAARALLPRAAFDGEVARIGAVYGRAYWQPALDLLQRSADPVVRAWAAAYAGERCLWADWRLACDLLGEIRRLAARQSADPACPPADLRRIEQARHDLAFALESELWRCRRDLERALELRAELHAGAIPDARLREGDSLWALLAPYLPAAIDRGPWDWRRADWMDLRTNRFRTHPGLRLAEREATAPGRVRSGPPKFHLRIVCEPPSDGEE